MGEIDFRLVWFDSLGAKSSCTLVKTPEVSILIDPGVAIMHPSFPAPLAKKVYWTLRAKREIKKAAREASVVIISHYHYDHFTDFDASIYRKKLILAKNPNEYINDSQRERAEHFYGNLFRYFGKPGELPETRREYPDPMSQLPKASRKDFGNYSKRRKELLNQGLKWFRKRVEKWRGYEPIPEGKMKTGELRWAEGREFRFGKTRVRLVGPLFHGIEFSRVGWVFATVIQRGKEKFIHSSDLNGPIIEDYADWIASEKPDVLILDGPMTYMLGYTLAQTTLKRCVENALRILDSAGLIIYDHHLPREPKFRKRTEEVWQKGGDRVMTAAEFLGKKPVVLG